MASAHGFQPFLRRCVVTVWFQWLFSYDPLEGSMKRKKFMLDSIAKISDRSTWNPHTSFCQCAVWGECRLQHHTEKFLFFFFLKTFFLRFSSSKTYTVNEFNYFLSDFCPTVLKVKRIKDCDSIIYPLFSCGGLTRTDDLWVMSPTSYQLLHSAMLCFDYGCKGTAFFLISKLFLHLFLK